MPEVATADKREHIACLHLDRHHCALQILWSGRCPLIVRTICRSAHTPVRATLHRPQLLRQFLFRRSLCSYIQRGINAQLLCIDIFTNTLFDFLAYQLREICAEWTLAMEAWCIACRTEPALFRFDCFL